MQYSKLQESPMRQLPSHNPHNLVSQSLVSRYIRSEATRPSSQRPVRRDLRRLRHDISSLRYELADKMKDTGKWENFNEPYPARVAYQVAKLPLGAKIEVDAIAIVGEMETVKSAL
ncbi:hypothetical protein B566_EDAN000830 [Ephemera danica]|nr:hypothetical protein B566_EDAN000830 [Ephemera danica]